jgi:hypothetical protein
VNFRTGLEDVEAVAELVVGIGKQVDGEMRQRGEKRMLNRSTHSG